MPKLSLSVSHTLGQEEAIKRLRGQFEHIKQAYGEQITHLQQQWNGNMLDFRLTALGATITGNVTAAPSDVKVEAHLPMMATMFKGTIEQQIRDQLGKLLA